MTFLPDPLSNRPSENKVFGTDLTPMILAVTNAF